MTSHPTLLPTTMETQQLAQTIAIAINVELTVTSENNKFILGVYGRCDYLWVSCVGGGGRERRRERERDQIEGWINHSLITSTCDDLFLLL